MFAHDYSQLPVLKGEREVAGMVSWKSLGETRSRGADPQVVRECMSPSADVVEESAPLATAVDIIKEKEVVLVRNHKRQVTAILTSADIVDHFDKVSGPFLLLRDIESHLKRLVHLRVPSHRIQGAADPRSGRKARDVHDLTLGEVVRMIDAPEAWATLRFELDRRVVVSLLEQVVRIRNSVMHFDPDPAGPNELEVLRRADRMLEKLGRGNAGGSQ